MTRESEIQRAVHERLGARPDVRLWRQNVGVGVPMSAAAILIRVAEYVRAGDYGTARALAPRALEAARRVIRFGVEGAADLSGILAGGRRLEVEVKSERGRQSDEQHAYQAMIERFGGVYILARSADEAEEMLARG